MFLLLTTEQISQKWPLIRKALEESHPPTSTANVDFYQSNLVSLLSGEKQCWVWADEQSEIGLCITTFIKDFDSGDRHLLIYTAYALSDEVIRGKMWTTAIKTLHTFAEINNCKKIITFTGNPRVAEIAKRVGMVTEWIMLELEV